MTIFALGLPINLSQHVQSSLQQGYISNLWMALGSMLSLTLVYIAAHRHAPIYVLVAIVAGVPVCSQLCNGLFLFGRQRPDLRPSLSQFERSVANTMLRSGLLFLGLGIAGALAYDSQNLVIAHVLGPAAVGTYAVVQRLYSTIPMVIAFVTQPLWPAFGEAIARQEWPWVYRALRRGVLLNAVIAVLPALLLSFFSRPIIAHWTHGSIIAPRSLVIGFSAMGRNLRDQQSYLDVAERRAGSCAFRSLRPFSSVFSRSWEHLLILPRVGISGGVWTMLTAYLVLQLGPYLVFLRGFFKEKLTPKQEVHAYDETQGTSPRSWRSPCFVSPFMRLWRSILM